MNALRSFVGFARMIDLTPATFQRVQILFPAATELVAKLLRRECADNLPLWTPATPEGLERIRFAVLKPSGGRLDRLNSAIRLAQVDWRDALMAAGFGHSVAAHRVWMPEAPS